MMIHESMRILAFEPCHTLICILNASALANDGVL